jgi:hypothetical protein
MLLISEFYVGIKHIYVDFALEYGRNATGFSTMVPFAVGRVTQKTHNKMRLFRDKVVKAIQGVLGGKYNILGGHSIGHSKHETLYQHVS